MTATTPPAQAAGLYDPRYEHDACGVALVARLDNRPSHEVVDKGLKAVENLEHRGATGADSRTGDGAGILLQMPDAFFRASVDFELPDRGRYGVAVCFLPTDDERRSKLEAMLELNVRVEGQRVLGWRDIPVDTDHVGETADQTRPVMRQLIVEAGPGFENDQDAFERKLYVIRRICELAVGPDLYVASFSSRTLVYKGMLVPDQLRAFFPDLSHPKMASAMALVHSRFSTNTFPSWPLAHPYRVIAHNGEINTLMGNVNWMRARESQLASRLFGLDLQKIMPIVVPGNSDTATFDNVLELLDARRPLAAARDDDDDPRGVRRSRRPARSSEGLLRLPLVPHGAVGRPRRGRLHGRLDRRRDARPQRPAPGPLGRDARRPRRARLRGRAAADQARGGQAPRPPAAGQALPRRPRAPPHRRGRGGQARGRDAPALRRVVRAQHGPLRRSRRPRT